MTRNYVFVYGTLKQGHRNHHYLDRNSAHVNFHGACHTLMHKFQMVQWSSGFWPNRRYTPGVLREGYNAIAGELYSVSDEVLRDLDDLERNGVEYNRREEALLVDGSGESAWMYHLKAGKSVMPADQSHLIHTDPHNVQTWLLEQEALERQAKPLPERTLDYAG